MSNFYCKNCGEPLEPHQSRPYGRSVPGLMLHRGESYLMNQKMSGLDAEDKAQLAAWNHPVVAVDASGQPYSSNFNPGTKLGRQFN